MVKSQRNAVVDHAEISNQRIGEKIRKQHVRARMQRREISLIVGKALGKILTGLLRRDIDLGHHQAENRNLTQVQRKIAVSPFQRERRSLRGHIRNDRRPADLEITHQQNVIRKL